MIAFRINVACQIHRDYFFLPNQPTAPSTCGFESRRSTERAHPPSPSMSSGKRQSTLRTFAKISKASAFSTSVKPAREALALSNKLCPVSKRKRQDSDEDAPSTFVADELAFDKIFAKKVR